MSKMTAVDHRKSLLRKRSHILQLLGAIVVLVLISSLCMLSIIQTHEETYGYTDAFDVLLNDVDDIEKSVDYKQGNMRQSAVNLRMRDTLALREDYAPVDNAHGYVNHLSNLRHGDPEKSLEKNQSKVKYDASPPLRKVTEADGEVRFQIIRDHAMIEKQRKLQKIRSQNWDHVENLVIRDDKGEYDYDSYAEEEEENSNPAFEPGDFDLPANFVKFKQSEERNLDKASDEQYYENENEDYYNYEEENSVEDSNLFQNENNLKPPILSRSNEQDTDQVHNLGTNPRQPYPLPRATDPSVSTAAERRHDGRRVSDLLRTAAYQKPDESNAAIDGVSRDLQLLNQPHAKGGGRAVAAKELAQRFIWEYVGVAVNDVPGQAPASRSRDFPRGAIVSKEQSNEANFPPVVQTTSAAYNKHGQSHLNTAKPLRPHLDVPSQDHVTLRDSRGVSLVVSGKYWSAEALQLVPIGISSKDLENFRRRVAEQPIRTMQAPTWSRCGRPKNQYVTLADGTAMCARYREPHVKFIQGEVLSFYLAQYLGFDNVPPVAIARVNSTTSQWAGVKSQMRDAEWRDNSFVALILWINSIDAHERIPQPIYNAFIQNSSISVQTSNLTSMSDREISDIVQWTDLILFDYLTGNYDRVASMQDGAEKENRPSIMTENIRNLRKDKSSGRLWLIDNESGLLDGYELMYRSSYTKEAERFIGYHQRMLKTLCIFNPQTVAKIRQLSFKRAPHQILVKYARENDWLFKLLPNTPSVKKFNTHFHTRLKEVIEWVDACESHLV